MVQIPHVWVLNAYESGDHLEEVKRPTSKDITFPVRHQVRIDSGSHHTPTLDRKSKHFVQVQEAGT